MVYVRYLLRNGYIYIWIKVVGYFRFIGDEYCLYSVFILIDYLLCFVKVWKDRGKKVLFILVCIYEYFVGMVVRKEIYIFFRRL